ncbi:MAG: response regulator [Alphaproteobacteria bacterium]
MALTKQSPSVRTARISKAVVKKAVPLNPVPDQATEHAIRILVAEDNPTNQKVLACLLQPIGCQLDFVENGLDAIAAVARSSYDLVLMDMRMPKMDGITATYRIRSLPEPAASIPIVVLTADAVAGAKENFQAAGMNGFIAKPIDRGLLFKAIEEHTEITLTRPDFV